MAKQSLNSGIAIVLSSNQEPSSRQQLYLVTRRHKAYECWPQEKTDKDVGNNEGLPREVRKKTHHRGNQKNHCYLTKGSL